MLSAPHFAATGALKCFCYNIDAMSCRRLLTGVLAAVLLAFTVADRSSTASSTAAQPGPQAATPRSRVVLTFPFDNVSGHPSLGWLAEGLAETTVEHIAGFGPDMLSRDERLAILERVGMPAETRLSRASMFKLAEQIGADHVIFGQYVSEGTTLTITARVLRTRPPTLSPEYKQSGTVDQWLQLEARLGWQLLCALEGQPAGSLRCGTAASESQFNAKLAGVPASAFESYARGLSGASNDERLGNLREASRLAPMWMAPAQALAESYFTLRDCDAALPWLARIPLVAWGGVRAGFEAGACQLLRNDPARAESMFKALLSPGAQTAGGSTATAARIPELYSNLGIALARQGKLSEANAATQRATQLRGDEPDYWLNLGLGQLRAKQPAAAVISLQRALTLEPDDPEVRVLHALALEQSGHSEEASNERKTLSAGGAVVPLPQNPGPADLARFDRIQMRIDSDALRPVIVITPGARATPEFPTAGAGSSSAASATSGVAAVAAVWPHRLERLQLHLDHGAQFLSSGDFDDAQRSFLEALLLSPLDPIAHSGLGETYWRQNRPDQGVREFRASLAGRDDAATRVLLARLLIEQKRSAEARTELQRALTLEPNNTDARQLLADLPGQSAPGSSR
jgi:Flp pilus assembly protein TadD/TolB-like protein